jgi:mono/diheme cytochrome c family protein
MAGSLGESSMPGMDASSANISGHERIKPANLADPRTMLGASPALLQGKILRGGMGTGMPAWGAIFTPDQTWALIAYLWTFQFSMEVTP